jgi:hypothetical protein
MVLLFFARARSRRSRRSQLSREAIGSSLIVEDSDLDDERGTTTMDDVGLDCQGPWTVFRIMLTRTWRRTGVIRAPARRPAPRDDTRR